MLIPGWRRESNKSTIRLMQIEAAVPGTVTGQIDYSGDPRQSVYVHVLRLTACVSVCVWYCRTQMLHKRLVHCNSWWDINKTLVLSWGASALPPP